MSLNDKYLEGWIDGKKETVERANLKFKEFIKKCEKRFRERNDDCAISEMRELAGDKFI